MRYGDILRQAIDKWGVDAQMIIVVEECAELIKAVVKHMRCPTLDTRGDIIDEMADVSIMIGQLLIIMDCEKEYDGISQVKFERLKRRLES